jgi:TPR repeat protein
MIDARSRMLALAAAVCVLGLAGSAAAAPAAKAAAAAKAPAAKASAVSPCDVLADDPEDPFRAAPGVEQHAIDVSKALPACQAALTADDTGGRLWYAYARVLQRAEDNKGALDAFQQAAARGYPIAENLLGVMFQNARQMDQAALWFRKSADHGYLPAQTIIASFYLNGSGVPQDNNQALAWYRKAADKGYPLAQVTLAAIYHGGLAGEAKDDQMALQWAKKAADQSYAPAESMVAGMHHNGWGVKQDDKAAFALYLKAADQGYQPAQAELGLMYHNGWGVPRDDKKAAQWLQMAADAGYAPATAMLTAIRQDTAGAAKP